MELLQNEELKDIENYEGRYAVSNFGRVYSFVSNKWLKPTANKHGNQIRYYVNLGRGTENRFYVHQLVAKHFLPNPDNLPEVDHIDTNPANNNVNNLRWVSHSENMKNKITQKHVKQNGGLLFEVKNILTNNVYWGYEAAAAAENVSRQTIINHCKNKVKKPRYQLTGRKLDFKRNKIFE
jgi:hypothetical protein